MDEITLSPLQKYRQYGRFPWEIVLTALMILSATLSVQSVMLTKYAQEKEVQTFFNFHMLQHDSFDIYEGSTVFTWRTQEYRNLEDIYEFFNRTLEVLGNLDSLNFFPVNTTAINQTQHTIKRVFRDGASTVDEFTLYRLIEDGYLTLRLKEFLVNVRSMKITFVVNDISANVQTVHLIYDIEIKQKFIFFVEIDTDFVKTNFTTDKTEVLPSEPTPYDESNLGIRKQPNSHHVQVSPPPFGYICGLFLIGLTVKSIFNRYSLYKKYPMRLDGITDGKQFVSLSFIEKIKLLGV